jgi:hypothetical protein
MSDYKQTRDAAGKVTAQYDKMLRSLGDDDLVRVTVSDGKYTFIQKEDGSCIALRYGEPWREDIFDGLMLGMAHRIEELEAELAVLEAWQDAVFSAHPNVDLDIEHLVKLEEKP